MPPFTKCVSALGSLFRCSFLSRTGYCRWGFGTAGRYSLASWKGQWSGWQGDDRPQNLPNTANCTSIRSGAIAPPWSAGRQSLPIKKRTNICPPNDFRIHHAGSRALLAARLSSYLGGEVHLFLFDALAQDKASKPPNLDVLAQLSNRLFHQFVHGDVLVLNKGLVY